MRIYAYVTWKTLSKVKLKLIYFYGSAYTRIHAQMNMSDAPKLEIETH